MDLRPIYVLQSASDKLVRMPGRGWIRVLFHLAGELLLSVGRCFPAVLVVTAALLLLTIGQGADLLTDTGLALAPGHDRDLDPEQPRPLWLYVSVVFLGLSVWLTARILLPYVEENDWDPQDWPSIRMQLKRKLHALQPRFWGTLAVSAPAVVAMPLATQCLDSHYVLKSSVAAVSLLVLSGILCHLVLGKRRMKWKLRTAFGLIAIGATCAAWYLRTVMQPCLSSQEQTFWKDCAVIAAFAVALGGLILSAWALVRRWPQVDSDTGASVTNHPPVWMLPLGALAFIVGCAPLKGIASGPLPFELALALTALGFYIFVVWRREMFPHTPWLLKSPAGGKIGSVLTPEITVALALSLIGFCFSIAFAYVPYELPVRIGTLPIALLGFAFIGLTVSSVFMAVPKRLEWPTLWILIPAFALVSSISVENHRIDQAIASTTVVRESLKRPAFNSLANPGEFARQWRIAQDLDVDAPLFVVAASGGGIRAAHWTAQALSAIDVGTEGRFSKHVIAISGVSGGSLGAAAYVASVPCLSADTITPAKRRALLGDFASGDFLAPVVANFLFLDLLQRFVPVNFLKRDRGWALARAWEIRWEERVRTHCPEAYKLDVQFLELYASGLMKLAANHGQEMPRTEDRPLPLLILNSTTVEEGKRAYFSPVEFPTQDAFDLFSEKERLRVQGIPLSSAVLNSARFTYISPAGLVDYCEKCDTKDETIEPWGRLVDGGYFDNSGATTASELATALGDVGSMHVHVLFLRNVPQSDADLSCDGSIELGISDDVEKDTKTVSRFASEIGSPIRALLAGREARGTLAEKLLYRTIHQDAVARCHEVFPSRTSIDGIAEKRFSLGWKLSKYASDKIERITCIRPKSETGYACNSTLERAPASVGLSTAVALVEGSRKAR